MKIFKNNKLMLAAIVFFLTATCVYSYPPDNAAVLYYKAAMSYEVDNEMAVTLADLQKGEIEVNNKIREFVKKNRLVINMLLDASEIKNCDWGLDISQGFEMEVPHLSKIRKLSRLVIADTKILAEDKDYEEALSRCMSLYKMARHVNDRIFMGYLVGIAVNSMTNNCVTQIMADMPQDMQSLTNLKNQLIEIDSISFSVEPAILGEREAALMFMTSEQLPGIIKLCGLDKSVEEKILSLDETALNRGRTYFENYYANVTAAFDMPYLQGDASLRNLEKKVKEDTKKNPDAILTEVLAPATHKIFSLKTRFETHNNAIKTALELYLIKAKIGKLPDELPAGLPGDLFSSKDFEYEKTSDGFILRCQGKDLGKNEIYEYEFKVKK